MILHDGDTEYRVHLKYETLVDGSRAVIADVHAGRCYGPEGTSCEAITYKGVAFCHPNDQFVRATGRKIALGRALRAMELDKPTRTRIWADYLRERGR